MTDQPERAIRSILVCGGGVVARSAALAFARALPMVKLSLLDLPVDPAALADRIPASLPSVGRFHAAARIDELELVRSGAAVHHLGTRFENWSANGETWIHAHGEYGIPTWPVPFRDLWPRARRSGRAGPPHRYSAAGVMAEAGKFVHPQQDGPWPLSSYRYGLRLDPEAYRELLDRHCAEARVERVEGVFGAVERNETGAAAVLIDGGRRLEADLFVDCSGPGALLLSAVEPAFEDWSALFPFARLRLDWAECAEPSPADMVAANADGWTWTGPLARRTLVATASADGEGVRLSYGRRPQPWVGNVLALGDAAATLDPLHGVNLHLAQTAILRALDLLPGRDFHPLELAEFNRRADQEVTRARDFLALHYLRSGRSDGEGWRQAAEAIAPDSLAHTLDQFEARGRLPFYEQESFTVDSWSAVLLGLAVLPRAADSAGGRFPFEGSVESLDRLAERLAKLPSQLPSYRDYLARMTQAAPLPRAPISSPRAS